MSYCSYGEAYEVNCARYGREADLPIAHFKKRCCSPSGNLISDPNGEIRLQARAQQQPSCWPYWMHLRNVVSARWRGVWHVTCLCRASLMCVLERCCM